MKHDYRKKTTWKLDDAFLAAWPGEKLTRKRRFSARTLAILIAIALVLVSGIWAYRHWHQRAAQTTPVNTPVTTITIPLSIPGS